MKANELMINDWVFYIGDKEPKQTQVIEITSLRQVQLFDGEDLSSWFIVGEKYIEPIPLTAEILEKNGFRKRNFEDIECSHKWTWWGDTNTSVILWCRKLNDNTRDGWTVSTETEHATCRMKVEAVHELQHIIRLCNIEKEIKLN